MATIELEDDARPIARVLAGLLRRSAADPGLGPVLERLDGVLGLQSATDPQRATIRFRSGHVYVEGGISDAAEVVITTDFSAPSGPDASKPGLVETARLVRAVARRPRFASDASKVLEPPLPDWTDAATGFWDVVQRRGGGPAGLVVVCTDDDAVLSLGAAADDAPQLHGSSRCLARCFVGEAVIGEEVVEGRLHARMSFGEFAVLTGHSLAVMLGD